MAKKYWNRMSSEDLTGTLMEIASDEGLDLVHFEANIQGTLDVGFAPAYETDQKKIGKMIDKADKKIRGKIAGINDVYLFSFNPVVKGDSMKRKEIRTKGEARQEAIDWQHWVSEQNLSYGELAEYGDYFTELARKFGLMREFRENGII